jgi:hypothetical protein
LKKYLIPIGLLLAIALAVPYINVTAWREPILNALQTALGRKVEISDVRFRVLPQPGFTVTNVTIGEDPSVGAEPAAYVTTLQAVPGVFALLRGKLEFSSVDLEDASLNLTRVDSASGVRWNFSSLMRPELLSSLPSIHMRGGRINFKLNSTKSLFYLLNTDVDLWPPSSAQDPWTLKVTGQPARTDHTAQGFGAFTARGEWRPQNSSTTLDVRLERSQLGDMLTLFNGYESSLQGEISGDAHLAGPLNHIGLAGRLRLANLHGWRQAPPGGNVWPLALGGSFDVTGQTIDLDARLQGEPSPFLIHYRVADYLKRPRWGVTANLIKFPLSPVVPIARNMGWSIPTDFKFDGNADGAVSYSMPDGKAHLDGQLNLSAVTFAVAGAPPLRIASADLRLAGGTAVLEPSTITNESNEQAQLTGIWMLDSNLLRAALSSEGMQIASLSKQISVAGIPLLSGATAGSWKGSLRYRSAPAGWAGDFHLDDAIVPFEAFAEPLHIVSADAAIDDAGLSVKRLNVSAGGIEAQGDYQYQPNAERPHKFHLTLAKTSGADIGKLMMPALHRGNFFTYAFNFGRAPEPDWLRTMEAEGSVQAPSLDIDGNVFTRTRARVIWDGMIVRVTNVDTQLGEEPFTGAVTVHLDKRQPVYEIEGKLAGAPLHTGQLVLKVSP